MSNNEKIIYTSRLSNTASVMSAITTALVCCILFFYMPNLIPNNKYVIGVKKAHPDNYPNVTYEDAFENFYTDPHWEYSEKNGSKAVVFTGYCNYKSKKTKIEMRYTISSDFKSFELSGGSIDGVEQSVFPLILFNTKPFEEYSEGR